MIFSALKPVIQRDSDPFRVNIFNELKKKNSLITFIEDTYRVAGLKQKSFLLFLYGMKSYLEAPEIKNGFVGIYSYQNEKRRFKELEEAFPENSLRLTRPHLSHASFNKIIQLLKSSKDLPRVLKLLSYIASKYDFLVCCRISSTIFYYFWFKKELNTSKPKGLLLSSEANPYAMAALWNAKQLHIPTIYIPHGQVAPNPPELFFDLVLLDGPLMLERFSETRAPVGKVLYKGTDGDFRPLRLKKNSFSSQTIGIFLSLIYNLDELEKIIRSINSFLHPREILLRLHPNEDFSSDVIINRVKDLKNIIISKDSSLSQDTDRCDLVICGNSGTHLEVLRHGVPSLQLPNLDLFPHDVRSFIRNGVVPYFNSVEEIKIETIYEFYNSNAWKEKMKQYDFHYGKSHHEVISYLKSELDQWFKARH